MACSVSSECFPEDRRFEEGNACRVRLRGPYLSQFCFNPEVQYVSFRLRSSSCPRSDRLGSAGLTGAVALPDRTVTMKDACDPATFNAVIGPGACLRSGGVTLEDFIAALTRHGMIGAWHFAPSDTTGQFGQKFVAVNRGGEVHTFTQVTSFGGGIVPLLNQLAHVPNVAPEFLHFLDPERTNRTGSRCRQDGSARKIRS